LILFFPALLLPAGDAGGRRKARALAVQPMFSQGMMYAPNRDWPQMVIDEMSMLPAGRYDGLTDSATQRRR
jgi:phage terminase large subunit-like protein